MRRSGDDMNTKTLCGFGEQPRGFAVRNRFGQREDFVAILEHVARVGQFWQHHQRRAVVRCGFDVADTLRHVVALSADMRFHAERMR